MRQAITDFLSDNTYLNITDSVFPSGEIRGQIIAVPEPSSLTMLAVTGVLLSQRRQRAAR